MCAITAKGKLNGHELTDIAVLNPGDWFGKACCEVPSRQETHMAAHFCPITRDEIHEFLTGLGFMPLKLKNVLELVYAKIVRIGGHHLSLRIYTAVNPDGESREKGTDAIRLRLFMRVGDGIVPVGRPQKCLRVESWRVNLRKAIERVAEPNNFRVCPACGNPQVLRQNKSTGDGFWGCSMFRITGCKGKRVSEGTPPVTSQLQEFASK